MANSTAKYAHNGELFALMSLGKDISEDTSAGRLILNNCSTVYITAAKNPSKGTIHSLWKLRTYITGKTKFDYFFFEQPKINLVKGELPLQEEQKTGKELYTKL